MANWDGTKPISTDTLNGGNQYTTDSQLSVQALNSIIESGLFSQNFVGNLQVAVHDSVGTPRVSLQPQVDNPNYKTIAFSGLKGDKGDTGVGIQSITITESTGN